jgi:hypothetical protein
MNRGPVRGQFYYVARSSVIRIPHWSHDMYSVYPNLRDFRTSDTLTTDNPIPGRSTRRMTVDQNQTISL